MCFGQIFKKSGNGILEPIDIHVCEVILDHLFRAVWLYYILLTCCSVATIRQTHMGTCDVHVCGSKDAFFWLSKR